jgi:CAAX protease family protein
MIFDTKYTDDITDLTQPKPLGIIGVIICLVCVVILQVLITVVYMIIHKALNPEAPLVIMMVFAGVLGSTSFAISAYFVYKVKFLPRGTISFSPKGIPFSTYFLIVILAPCLVFLGMMIAFLMLRFLPMESNNTVQQFAENSILYPWIAWVLIFMTVILAPFTEELFFRGIIFRSLRGRGYKYLVSILITGVLFSAVHMTMMGFISLLIVSLVLTHFSEKSRSLFPAMFLHGIYNLIIMGIALSSSLLKKPEINQFMLEYKKPPSDLDLVSIPVNLGLILLFGGAVYFLTNYIGKILESVQTENHPINIMKNINETKKEISVEEKLLMEIEKLKIENLEMSQKLLEDSEPDEAPVSNDEPEDKPQ